MDRQLRGFSKNRRQFGEYNIQVLVAFGVPYIANPDLVERFRTNAVLNKPDPATFYGVGARGYTDYPMLIPARAA